MACVPCFYWCPCRRGFLAVGDVPAVVDVPAVAHCSWLATVAGISPDTGITTVAVVLLLYLKLSGHCWPASKRNHLNLSIVLSDIWLAKNYIFFLLYVLPDFFSKLKGHFRLRALAH